MQDMQLNLGSISLVSPLLFQDVIIVCGDQIVEIILMLARGKSQHLKEHRIRNQQVGVRCFIN